MNLYPVLPVKIDGGGQESFVDEELKDGNKTYIFYSPTEAAAAEIYKRDRDALEKAYQSWIEQISQVNTQINNRKAQIRGTTDLSQTKALTKQVQWMQKWVHEKTAQLDAVSDLLANVDAHKLYGLNPVDDEKSDQKVLKWQTNERLAQEKNAHDGENASSSDDGTIEHEANDEFPIEEVQWLNQAMNWMRDVLNFDYSAAIRIAHDQAAPLKLEDLTLDNDGQVKDFRAYLHANKAIIQIANDKLPGGAWPGLKTFGYVILGFGIASLVLGGILAVPAVGGALVPHFLQSQAQVIIAATLPWIGKTAAIALAAAVGGAAVLALPALGQLTIFAGSAKRAAKAAKEFAKTMRPGDVDSLTPPPAILASKHSREEEETKVEDEEGNPLPDQIKLST